MVIFLNRSCGACLVGQAMETSPLFDPKTSEKKTIGAVSLILISLW